MMKEHKFLPEGYRYLELGELIRINDWFWNDSQKKWVKVRDDADTANWVKEHLIREEK